MRTLQGTLTQDKNELLFSRFDINYSALLAQFRKVSWHSSGRPRCFLAGPRDLTWTAHCHSLLYGQAACSAGLRYHMAASSGGSKVAARWHPSPPGEE